MMGHESFGGESVELNSLFPKLCRFSISCSRRMGCIYPEDCGTDIVTEYLIVKRFRKAGRGKCVGEQIILNFPDARDQRKVLYALLKAEVRGRRSRCADCKHKNDFCRISDGTWADEDDEPRVRQQILIDPKTPEDFLLAKEQLERIALAVGDRVRLREFIDRMVGESYKELARRSGRPAQNIRQSVARLRRKIARLLDVKTPPGGKRFTPSRRKHSPDKTHRVVRAGGGFCMLPDNDPQAE